MCILTKETNKWNELFTVVNYLKVPFYLMND